MYLQGYIKANIEAYFYFEMMTASFQSDQIKGVSKFTLTKSELSHSINTLIH